ncbi:MAG: hypothetical protein ACTMIR_14305, partial [Cellulomonadaceae bacterium]
SSLVTDAPTARAVIAAVASGMVLAVQGRLNGDLGAAGAGPVVAAWLSYVGTLAATAVLDAVGAVGLQWQTVVATAAVAAAAVLVVQRPRRLRQRA